MYSLQWIVTFISCVVLRSSASSLAPFINKCAETDSTCILKSAEIALPYFIKGIPELKVKPFEPLLMKNVKADTGDLKLTFNDMNLVGTSKTKFISIVYDPTKLTCKLVLEFPVHVTGQYVMGGNLLLLEVNGEGDFNIRSDKIQIIVNIKMKTTEDGDGNKHLKITGFDFELETPEKVHLKFDNLYGGDKSKADPVNKVIDESWKELSHEMGKPVIKETITKIVKMLDQFFQIVPYQDLFLI